MMRWLSVRTVLENNLARRMLELSGYGLVVVDEKLGPSKAPPARCSLELLVH